MVQSQCPVCGEVGGFHNKTTHDGLLMPAASQLPSGWLKQYREEQDRLRAERLALEISQATEEPVDVVVIEEGQEPIIIGKDTLIGLVTSALKRGDTVPPEVLQLLPEGWFETLWEGDSA